MNLYNVYDMEGNEIISGKDSKEIARLLDVTPIRVAKCSSDGKSIRRMYKIEKNGEAEKEDDKKLKAMMLEEWDEVTAPFRKVTWVKEESEATMKLVFNALENKFVAVKI